MQDDTSSMAVLSDALRDRRGPDRSLTIAQIGEILNLGRRQTETFLELHLADLPFCVVSSSQGYHRPAAAEDINHYCASLRSRIRCLAIRSRSVKMSAVAEGWRHENGRFVDHPVAQELPQFRSCAGDGAASCSDHPPLQERRTA